ncbi:F0F1 ATP synthase subunit B [Elioraea sp.]|uniref:F0F1 ATP synthase subunit B family protein n=1 Tax=Elioraea sp. TaxID=2185103 RepID=UPI0025BB9037|nr:F0F1 ATP synthase subunit B [Elioraea sp.]
MSDPKFWVAISFVIFIALAWKPLIGRFLSGLDARSARIKAEIDEAQRLRTEAEAMLKRAEAARADAEKEAAALLAHAREEAARVTEAARVELDVALKRREKMALDRIAAAEAEAAAAVRNAAADVAIAAARNLIASGLTQDGHASLVDAAIADIPQKLH